MDIKEVVNNQREFYNKHILDDINVRIKKLKQLKKIIIENEKEINDALEADLGKSNFESYMTEVGLVLSEISYMIKHLKKFNKKKYVYTPLSQFPAISFKKPVSYGVVLIIAPWNYPFLLSIQPLVGAIASGNCVILKPSEYSVNTSNIIEKLIKKIFKEEFVTVIQGEKEVSQELLEQKFDYIFYTGSTRVGKIVMKEAANNLTPVTLELGGKSPVIVDDTSSYKLAAKRIIFGKILNAGQTCVAPDYILVDRKIKKDFVNYLKTNIKAFLGENILENSNYPKIINKKQYDRLESLIRLNENNITFGGNSNLSKLKIEPTLIELGSIKEIDKIKNNNIMEDEIFGPILPIIEYNNIDEAIEYIKNKPRPLALYLFTKSKNNEKKILTNIRFGGGCINDTIIHLANEKLGFGGIGASGMGQYHGKKSLETFSHYVSVIKKSNLIDLPIRYHSYTKLKESLLRIFLK